MGLTSRVAAQLLVALISVTARAQTPATTSNVENQLRLSIETPGLGAGTVSGSVVVSGWALDSGGPVSDVQVSVDGNVIGTASGGKERSDICILYGTVPGCPNVGWSLTLNTGELTNGTHTLLITASSSSNEEASMRRSFLVANDRAPHPLDVTSKADFQLSVNPGSLTLSGANTATANLVITPVSGFTGTVLFTCSVSGLSNTSCAVPGTVASSGTATLIVNASSTAQTLGHPTLKLPRNLNEELSLVCLATAFLLLFRRLTRAGNVSRTAAVAASILVLAGCGGDQTKVSVVQTVQPQVQSGTVTVMASSGDVAHTASIAVTVNPASDSPLLTADDVRLIVQDAAIAIDSPNAVIAVTDRLGRVLGVFRKPNSPATAIGNFGASVDTNELAVALARTASFFSNDQAPLSSRTVRYISGIHFPPGVQNTPSAALYGIENTNRGCTLNAAFAAGQDVPAARSIDGSKPGLGVLTGKADLVDSDPNAVNPGGVPLFKAGTLVGAVGVAGVPAPVAEYSAYSAAVNAGFGAHPAEPGEVVIDGIAVPFVNQITAPPGVQLGTFDGTWSVNPIGSPSSPPEGFLVPAQAGTLGGLSQAEVHGMVQAAIAEADLTRALIRLPSGSRARFVIAVADLDGKLIALYRMTDATIFSIDVAVAKARNVIYFTGSSRQASDLPGVPMNTAVTNRTISFGAQPLFPPGIANTTPGPFFPLYQFDTLNPCTQGQQTPNANQNGIVFFPGSAPLYRNGTLVGGLGVSGDGVDQDDFVTNAGVAGFQAPDAIRADQVLIQNVRLPYLHFPRDPTN